MEAGEHAREKERRGGRGTRAIERERRTHTHSINVEMPDACKQLNP